MSNLKRRLYEQDRLILYTQEALATAVEKSGLKRSEVARALGVSAPYVTMVLNQGRNLTLESIADFAKVCGFRVVPKLTRIK